MSLLFNKAAKTRITFASNPSADSGLTLMAQVYWDRSGSDDLLIGGTNNSPFHYLRLRGSLGRIFFRGQIADGVMKNVIGTSLLVPTNEWAHIAVTSGNLIGEKITLYLNAIADVKQETLTGSLSNPHVPNSLGANNAITNYQGRLAEVSVWNRILPQREIQSRMNRKLSGGDPGLIAYLPIDDAGSGTSVIIKDLSGSGSSGAMNNFTGNPWMSGPPVNRRIAA